MSLYDLIKIARSADDNVKNNNSKVASSSRISGRQSRNPINSTVVEARREALVRALHKQYIKLAYEPGDNRALFYAVRNKADMTGLAGKLNGIILDLATLKFICIPSMGFDEVINDSSKENFIKSGFDKNEYDVYAINDGTTVNVYYYNGKWQIATARGVSVNMKKWYGLSWTSVLKSVFERFNVKLGGLDKDRTYSFTIQHPEYHPIINDYGLSIISIVSHTKFNENYDNNLRQPINKTIIPGVGFQRQLRNMNLGKIMKFNKTSIDHFLNTGVKNFGYILRRKDANSDGCDIVMPSTLRNYIADHIYDVKADMELNRTNYINLYNYVNNDGLYSRIFPQYQDHFNELNTKIANLIERILNNDPDTRRLESVISKNITFKDKSTESYRKNLEFLIMNKEFTNDLYNHIY